jgi:hypothetical protein
MHISNYLIVLTGIGYGVLKYFMKVDSQYGLLPNPNQKFFLYAHILVAPIFIFGIGCIWNSHIQVKRQLKQTPKKITGKSLFYLVFIMIASGYLIQTQVELKNIWIWVHIVISVIWIPLYLVHHFKPIIKPVAKNL